MWYYIEYQDSNDKIMEAVSKMVSMEVIRIIECVKPTGTTSLLAKSLAVFIQLQQNIHQEVLDASRK